MTTIRFELPPFDIDGDGSTEALAFGFDKNLSVEHTVRTGWLTEGGGSTTIDLLSDIAAELNLNEDFSGKRKGLYTDLGGGVAVVQVDAEITTGDNTNQWGTGNGGTWDAAGGTVLEKMAVLNEALIRAEIDSRPGDGNYPEGHLASLHVGEYSSGGRFDPIDVVPEEPKIVHDTERESSTATVSINFASAASLEAPWDGQKQSKS
ncbi:hypothetical protein [Haloarcula pellucida]|uniref:Uncharacterized protein n=1 Tax=Haloarcula pellucida TaxID=1427151 RepID=A0A830GS49_9EURY|nr:hypothetical protein [Halomicroarcula pellucida]MBX0350388.1 hypothetical protein [Halomicroarcula pellucida]GGO01848.1 hypothetical protein GCM10009030_35930 [Halomicroarcula pellucida]